MQTAIRPQKLKFETAAVTHVGCVRQANEDNLIVRPDLGLWAVADGAGGHDGGQFASQAVIDALESIGSAVSHVDLVARFEDRIHQANTRIIEQSDALDGATMGSTVVALLTYRGQLSWLWAGDSRAYRLRDGQLSQLTRDHSEVQELIDAGTITPQEALTWPRRNVITRAVGVFDEPLLEVQSGDIRVGDTFLLCSDGLTGHVSDAEIATEMDRARAQDACDALLEMVLARGGRDNVTIIVMRCHRAENTHFIPGGKATTGRAAP